MEKQIVDKEIQKYNLDLTAPLLVEDYDYANGTFQSAMTRSTTPSEAIQHKPIDIPIPKYDPSRIATPTPESMKPINITEIVNTEDTIPKYDPSRIATPTPESMKRKPVIEPVKPAPQPERTILTQPAYLQTPVLEPKEPIGGGGFGGGGGGGFLTDAEEEGVEETTRKKKKWLPILIVAIVIFILIMLAK